MSPVAVVSSESQHRFSLVVAADSKCCSPEGPSPRGLGDPIVEQERGSPEFLVVGWRLVQALGRFLRPRLPSLLSSQLRALGGDSDTSDDGARIGRPFPLIGREVLSKTCDTMRLISMCLLNSAH